MTFLEALEEIKRFYPIYQRVSDVAEIRVNKLLTPLNFFYVALIDYKGMALLSDIGMTADSFSTVEEQEWVSLCEKHHVSWIDWHIETEYEGIASLNNFLSVLEEASETMQGR